MSMVQMCFKDFYV